MRRFEDINPISITVYFLCVTMTVMFSMDPIILALALLGAVLYIILRGRFRLGKCAAAAILLAVGTVINPLVSHNGATVLFVINDLPFTLEALVYGAVSTGVMLAVLLLFGSYTGIMTRDKLLYVFGSLSPKAALILSMGLRYVPLFGKRARQIRDTQKALGLYKDENIFDRLRCEIRVFSILISWALENGITTADSMTARGYGRHRRTHFSTFKFYASDVVIICLSLALCALTAVGMIVGAVGIRFYPTVVINDPSALGIAAYAAYGILAMLPSITEISEKLTWKIRLHRA